MTDSPNQAAAKIRLYATLGMYQAGELSIGAACELAGIDRYLFLDICKWEGITLCTQTADELETEFQHIASNL